MQIEISKATLLELIVLINAVELLEKSVYGWTTPYLTKYREYCASYVLNYITPIDVQNLQHDVNTYLAVLNKLNGKEKFDNNALTSAETPSYKKAMQHINKLK